MSHSSFPTKVIQVVGDEATEELYENMDQRDQEVAATKVDKADYDAHAALIAERLQRIEDKSDAHARYVDQQFEIHSLRFDKKLSDAKRDIIVWNVGLVTAVTGVWTAVIIGLLK